MVDYTKFDEIVARKKKQQKYLSLEEGESTFFTFLGITAGIRQNPFSGDEEEVWFVTLEDDEGNKKRWTIASLYIFNQFKEQDIQEGDRIKIAKIRQGNKTRYLVEKIKLTRVLKPLKKKQGKRPLIEEKEQEI